MDNDPDKKINSFYVKEKYNNTTFKSLSKPVLHANNNLRTGKQSLPSTNNDFLTPISVKSSSWGSNRIDLSKLKTQRKQFTQYTHEKPIPKYRGLVNGTEEQLSESEIIRELIKPKEKSLTLDPIDPSARKIPNLKVDLLDHQVRGLQFLLSRELDPPETSCKNNGGILADDMGLGKTVQTIALLLSHTPLDRSTCATNLIVCPASLVSQWMDEINNKAPILKVLVFHGIKRPQKVEILHEYDVVIISYQTLISERSKPSSPIFNEKFPFWRIVLDEAQAIKNSKTSSNKACCSIIAQRRWCLTGTPIQNNVDELYGLFKFLGVNKYQDFLIWKTQVAQLLTEKNSTSNNKLKALNGLREVLDRCMLRRKKDVFQNTSVVLKKKIIKKETLDFTAFERKIYDSLRQKIISTILRDNDILEDYNDYKLVPKIGIKLNYTSALTYLLRLRQACCHWQLLFDIQETHKNGVANNDIDCESYLTDIKKSIRLEKLNNQEKEDDLSAMLETLSLNQATNSAPELATDSSFSSIKIQRTLNILKSDKLKIKKTIIFSDFTSMLDILQKELENNKIKYVRYDGKMNKNQKDESLNKLRTDSSIHVLLCSLRCGAYGLNLTCCSRVILYEPFWNPAIQAQAIDRVYRIGQTEEVEVYQYFIDDTVETKIRELQDKKMRLADAVTDKDRDAILQVTNSSLTKSELLSLLGIDIE